MKKIIVTLFFTLFIGAFTINAQTRVRLCFDNYTSCPVTICPTLTQVCNPTCGSPVTWPGDCININPAPGPGSSSPGCIEDPVLGFPPPECPTSVCHTEVTQLVITINGVSTTLSAATLRDGGTIGLSSICDGKTVEIQWNSTTQRWSIITL